MAVESLIGIILIAIGLTAIFFAGKKLNVREGRIMKFFSLPSSPRIGIILVKYALGFSLIYIELRLISHSL